MIWNHMTSNPIACERKCFCGRQRHDTGLIVVTGGPGAGKTAVLEMARKNFCGHVAALPESASIVFGGGFWRLSTDSGRMAAQRAIFHVQREMEEIVLTDPRWALGLCDRGTLDGLAFWPQKEELFWDQIGSSKSVELSRYRAVIHLRTPTDRMGYNHQNELRIETAEEAAEIDARIAAVWQSHPRYIQIDSSHSFLVKAQKALQEIEGHVPECCRLPI